MTLQLFRNSCSQQNKNHAMLTLLIYFLEQSKSFMKVIYYYPVMEHSYMPSEQVSVGQKITGRRNLLYLHKNTTVFLRNVVIRNYGAKTGWHGIKERDARIVKNSYHSKHFKLILQYWYVKTDNKVQENVWSTNHGPKIPVNISKPRIRTAKSTEKDIQNLV